MFYDARKNDHGHEYDPFKAIVAPRPIGWISSLSPEGVANLAPYSFFNAMSDNPHYVVFGSAGRKDSIRNIEATGEFVHNMATFKLREQMNASSAPVAEGVDEFELAGLEKASCNLVKPPRVAASPVALRVQVRQDG
jgi:flavin reductase (DIM6/NTAB) family NADH-FMN oxidoreductase RutF